ncbi:MAG: hypothetical protein K0U63_04190 [Cyanobacteria bacterium]|nr:hypothetical protein [Cyanobacteriota bacterium]
MPNRSPKTNPQAPYGQRLTRYPSCALMPLPSGGSSNPSTPTWNELLGQR